MNFGIYRPTNQQNNQTQSSNCNSNTQLYREDRASHPPLVNQLSDFVAQLEEYTPTVPDSVTSYFLNSSGFHANDPRIVRLISIAAQKFISDVANDALQNCKIRQQTKAPKFPKDRKYTLTEEDLSQALADYGITLRKAQYFP